MEVYKNLDLQDLNGEIWKIIEEYPDYQVSNIGRVKSLKFGKERILKQCKNKNIRYFHVDLYKNKNRKSKLVHRLVYETNIKKLEDGYDSHHINENEKDNFIENLEAKEHSIHSKDHNKGKIILEKTKRKISDSGKGRMVSEDTKIKISRNHDNRKGENNSNSILTDIKVIQIKMLFKLNFKIKKIANIFKVCERTIYNIRSDKTWIHIII